MGGGQSQVSKQSLMLRDPLKMQLALEQSTIDRLSPILNLMTNTIRDFTTGINAAAYYSSLEEYSTFCDQGNLINSETSRKLLEEVEHELVKLSIVSREVISDSL